MERNGNYDICPKCGYIMRDGMCQSCNYTEERKETDYFEPKTKKRKKRGVPSFLYALAAIFLIAFFAFATFVISAIMFWPSEQEAMEKIQSVIGTGTTSDESETENFTVEYEGKLWDYFSRYSPTLIYKSSEVYTDDPYDYKDEEYYFFDDYIDTSVNYDVVKHTWGFSNSDGYFDAAGGKFPRNLYIYYTFCQLENTGLANEEEINADLFEACHDAADMYEAFNYDYKDKESLYIDGYVTVTYMDSDVISFIYETDGYYVEDPTMDNDNYKCVLLGLEVRNIDLKTGKNIDTNSMFTFNADFVDEMISECARQNEGTDITKYYKKSELVKMAVRGEIIWFYTPVGIEFGVMLPDYNGFTTFTSTDYEKFIKH